MKLSVEQQKAKILYIAGKKSEEISKEVGVSTSTVYRWIKDEKLGFEESKKLANLETKDMASIVDEAQKKMLLGIVENPEGLHNPKTADALCKVAGVFKTFKDRAKDESEEEANEERGVLIIDDVELELIKKTAEETIKDSDSELL